jgi:hypothetical protein
VPNLFKCAAPLLIVAAAFAPGTVTGQSGGSLHRQADHLVVGQGVFCNTAQQVERFAALAYGKHNAEEAISIVNQEARDSEACGQTLAAFVCGAEVAHVDNRVGAVRIKEITIFAVPVGDEWQAISPVRQFAAFPQDDPGI